jgi:hypothetical protein
MCYMNKSYKIITEVAYTLKHQTVLDLAPLSKARICVRSAHINSESWHKIMKNKSFKSAIHRGMPFEYSPLNMSVPFLSFLVPKSGHLFNESKQG